MLLLRRRVNPRAASSLLLAIEGVHNRKLMGSTEQQKIFPGLIANAQAKTTDSLAPSKLTVAHTVDATDVVGLVANSRTSSHTGVEVTEHNQHVARRDLLDGALDVRHELALHRVRRLARRCVDA